MVEIDTYEFFDELEDGLTSACSQHGVEFKASVDDALPLELLIDSEELIPALKLEFSKFIRENSGISKIDFEAVSSSETKKMLIIEFHFTIPNTSFNLNQFDGLDQFILNKRKEDNTVVLDVRFSKMKDDDFSFVIEKNVMDVKDKNLNGLKVLVVEDNDINMDVLERFLLKWNAQVFKAFNGKEAVDSVAANDYDVVIMDIQMPIMDGYEATLNIRKLDDPKKNTIQIYALTASVWFDKDFRIAEHKMNGYFTKPFKPEELYNTLSQIK